MCISSLVQEGHQVIRVTMVIGVIRVMKFVKVIGVIRIIKFVRVY
jgi:hypothetical protein